MAGIDAEVVVLLGEVRQHAARSAGPGWNRATDLARGKRDATLGYMDTPTPHLIGPLYHGTRAAAARCILRDGFRRSRSRSYTGTGICLSESLTLAYEYGMYETGGCVLQARLAPAARWTDHLDGGARGAKPGTTSSSPRAWMRYAALAATSG